MYHQHFGLIGSPFGLAPSDRPFFSAAQRAVLEALERGVEEEPSGLMLLIGEVGTGKTTLIRTLLAHRNPGLRIARLSNPMLTFEQMLQLITQEIRIYPIGKGKIAILQALKTYLMDPDDSDRIVLIFDEAQGLSDEILEELRLLVDSTTESGRQLQIVLIGQPELARRLSQPKLRALDQRIGARAVLPPLDSSEVHNYVEHHLREQGGELTTFTRGGLRRLTRLSGGIPRRINMICDHSLSRAFAEGSTVVKSRHVRAAAAEYDDVLSYSARRPFRIPESARLNLNWPGGKSTKVVVGSVLALAATGVIFAFAFNTHYGKDWSFSSESSDSVVSPLQSPSLDQSGVDDGTAQAPESGPPVSQDPFARKPVNQSLASSVPLDGGLPARGATDRANAQRLPDADVHTKPSETLPGALPPSSVISPDDESAASTSKSALSIQAQNSNRYDLKRAQGALQSGRYDTAIWHLERAIARDPGNPALTGMLADARRAKAAAQVASLKRHSIAPVPAPLATPKEVAKTSAPAPFATPKQVANTVVPAPLATPKEVAKTSAPAPFATPKQVANTSVAAPFATPKEVAETVVPAPFVTPRVVTNTSAPAPVAAPKQVANTSVPAPFATPKAVTNTSVPASFATPKQVVNTSVPAPFATPKEVAKTVVPAPFATPKMVTNTSVPAPLTTPKQVANTSAPALFAAPKEAASTSAPVPLATPKQLADTGGNNASPKDAAKVGGIDIVKYETDQGDACMRKGDFDTALRKFRVALAMDPENEDLENRVENAQKLKDALTKNSAATEP